MQRLGTYQNRANDSLARDGRATYGEEDLVWVWVWMGMGMCTRRRGSWGGCVMILILMFIRVY